MSKKTKRALWAPQDESPGAELARAFWTGTATQQKLAAQRAIARGADVNAPAFDDGTTPLMAACAGGCTDTVRILCELGADIAARRADGATALWVAAMEHAEHGEAVEILASHGAREEGAGPGGASLKEALSKLGDPGRKMDLVERGARSPASRLPSRGRGAP